MRIIPKFLIVFAVIVTVSASCSRTKYLVREDFSRMEKKSSAQIILIDGTEHKIRNPRIENEQVIGTLDDEALVSFDFEKIDTIAIKEFDAAQTIIFGAVGVGTALLILSSLDNNSTESDDCYT